MEFKISVDKDIIERIRSVIGRDSYSEVVDDAVALLQWVLKEEEEGNKILLRNKDGKDKQIIF